MSKHKDRTGERHGKLVVLRRVTTGKEYKRIKRYSTSAVWLCACDCGTVKAIAAERLQKGAKSCGCSRKPIDELGNRFGRLVVTARAKSRDNRLGAFWHCDCDCGNKICVLGTALRYGSPLSCGCWQEDATSIACAVTYPIILVEDDLAKLRLASSTHRRPPTPPVNLS